MRAMEMGDRFFVCLDWGKMGGDWCVVIGRSVRRNNLAIPIAFCLC
jgi:hypothetical protein